MKTMIMALVVVVGMTAAAGAQTFRTVEADIPFDWQVSNQTLKAGTYQFSTPVSGTIKIQSDEGESVLMTIGMPSTPKGDHNAGKLTFNRVGGQYFLSAVQSPGAFNGLTLRKSSAERELSAKAAPTTIGVVARSR